MTQGSHTGLAMQHACFKCNHHDYQLSRTEHDNMKYLHGLRSHLARSSPRWIRFSSPERQHDLLQGVQHVCVCQIRLLGQRLCTALHCQASAQPAAWSKDELKHVSLFLSYFAHPS